MLYENNKIKSADDIIIKSYSIPIESNYIAIFFSINNESQYVSLLWFHWDVWHMLHHLF